MKRSLILTLLLMAITLASFGAIGPITGSTLSICTGASTTLFDSTGGGSWSSSNPSVATISPTGHVNGISPGTSTISYVVFSGTGGPEVATAVVTVNAVPTITGSSMLCVGSTATYVGTPIGGLWSSATTGVISIGATSGIATTLTSGITVISYTLPTGCYKTLTVTVNTTITGLSGPSTVCAGSDITLTHPATGGIWSSSTPPVATVGDGVVHGINPGTTTISYTLGSGCSATKTVTVTPGLAPITGPSSVLVGGFISLSATPAGGTWSSSPTSVATVSSSGFVTGVSPGTAVVTYTKDGCSVTKVITVEMESGVPITGPTTLCVGATATYSLSVSDSTGGEWSSSNPSVAEIDMFGHLTALSAGTTTISYVPFGPGGSMSTMVVTISATPTPIVGPTTVCLGGVIFLTDAVPGGSWSSSNSSVATVGPTGLLTGVGLGTAIITYSLPAGCFTTTTVTVGPSTAPITGPSSLCVGSTITLSDVTPGGTWSSSFPAIASVGMTTGIVTGNTNGTATITYSVGGCFATRIVTVTSSGAIYGPSTACIGFPTSYLSDSSGTWASSTPAIGTIGATSGIFTGISAGVTTITFTHAGCTTVKTVTVTAAPPAITGSSSVCTGATITLADALLGGTWSSSNTAIATVNTTTGVVTGITPGTAIITYTIGTGCSVTKVITVSSGPGPISGPSSVCTGATITLTDPTPGGVWITSNIITAPISSSGVVTGGAVGSVTITYSLGGCKVTKDVSVITTPAVITGSTAVCVGSSTTLFDATTGGTWSSSTPAVATVSATGVVTGMSPGTATISYTNSCGSATRVVTVNAGPAAIAGPSSLCVGGTATLSSAPIGGIWSVSPAGIATIGAGTGIITGVMPGSAFVTYTMATGCFSIKPIIVNSNPTPITGTFTVSVGSTTDLSDATSIGVWSSSTPAVATVNAIGTVTGITPGTATITYTLPTSCFVTAVVTVTPASVTPPISGPTAVCQGANVTYTETVAGTWSSSDGTVAVIDPISGILTPLLPGTTTVTFVPTTGSPVSIVVTVNPQPTSLWASNVCVGSTTLATTTSVGGTWISSNPSIAAVDNISGLITGISAGAASISYVYTATGCATAVPVTVNPNPAPITGVPVLCEGGTTMLSDATPGGTWSSTNTAIAAVDGISGMVMGLTPGVATINYTLGTTCWTSITVTVTPAPAAISGPSTVCVGSSVTLSDLPTGGTWSSSNVLVATVGVSSGVVTGTSAGVVTISYTLGSGCSVTKVMTVTPGAAPISGTLTLCTGTTTTLTDAMSGGTWASSNPTVATINAAGVVTGISFGISTITYTLPGGCSATAVVTVMSTPSAISGSSTVCVGSTITLTDAVPGGSWSSSNPGVATTSITGVITGVASGVATISYTTSCGSATKTVTVIAAPAAIGGPSSVCIGSTITLTDATLGGTWSSSAPTFASVGLTSGIVTGISMGTATITYKLPSGCFITKTITVTSGAGPISGPTAACVGVPVTYTVADSGGTWASSVPTINPVTGVLVSGSAGLAIITYTSSTGCKSFYTVTISPSPAAISGPSSVCVGGTISLTDATPGGIWSSSNPAVASVNATTGVLTGVAGGGVTITYTVGSGCYVTKNVSVTPTSPITGPSTVCTGSTITLADAIGGGTWSSSNPAVATVNVGTGVVTGISTGSAVITYNVGGCITTKTITVGPGSPITGPGSVCVGSSITLFDSTFGGVWMSGNPSVAFVDSASGVVTGISFGLATITYSAGGCTATKTITVNSLPAPIIGSSSVCVGGTTTLTDATSGGTWSSSNPAIATVNAAGVVTGISTGTATITYTAAGSGCKVTKTITVTGAAPIVGPSFVCVGSTITLFDSVAGGTWLSSNPSVAFIDSASGVVTGISLGFTTITYVSGGCIATKTITVNPLPAPISGSSSVCVGGTTTLTDATPGGTWSSSNPAVATVSTAGVVTGVSTGTVTITYTAAGSGCKVTRTMTVTAGPAPISGPFTVCAGGTITLTDAVPGGVWSSSNPAIASINPTTGVVTGVFNGSAVITYSVGGCMVTRVINVSGVLPIMGSTTLCVGATSVLFDSVFGGMWSSSNPGVASVDSLTGLVHGNSAGVATITYAIGSCFATTTVTVNPGPAPIAGSSTLCIGTTTLMTDATPGGTWSSSNTSVATVGATGLVTAVGSGVATIKYTLPSGCVATKSLTVNPAPFPITGPSGGCVGSTFTLTDSISGGTWSSSNTFVATVGSTSGIVTGLHAGVVSITYSIGGCSTVKTLTISLSPAAITGAGTVCVGSTILLSDATAGGTWSSNNTSRAVVSGTGLVTGVSSGVVTISYTVGGCSVTKTITVNAAPFPISGGSSVCVGSTLALTDSISGGVWISSSPAIAAVGATTGIVSGLAPGTAVITYSIGGCSVTKTITVSAAIAPITGSSSVCVGTTITLADATAGGTWSSSNPAKATVTSTGMVTGVSAGVVTIIYTKGGCSVSKTVTVNNAPGPIAGGGAICAGGTLTLTDATPGGTWLSSNPLVATIGSSTGVVTGVATGFIVAYYSAGGCSVYTTVTVTASPKAISGPSSVCAGSTVVLSDLTAGGLWISSNIAIATVNPVGHVTGVSAGLVTISYMVGSCSATKSLTVNPCGKIGGIVKAGAGKGTNATIAVTGMLVELVDAETNNVVAQTSTDASGAYEFIELGYGNYLVVPKEDGFSTTPSSAVAITKTSLISENINFVKNNGDKTIAPYSTTGTAIQPIIVSGVNVYPNPSNGDLNITWDGVVTGTANVVVTNVVGTEVYKGTLDINTATGESRIDLKNLKSGMYLITIKSDNISYSSKLFIQQ